MKMVDWLKKIVADVQPAVDKGLQQGLDIDAVRNFGGGPLHIPIRVLCEHYGHPLKATVYRYDRKMFLVTSIQWKDGLSREFGDPSVLPIDIENEVLNKTICEHLLRHESSNPILGGSPRGMSYSIKNNWPIFMASKAKSMTSFESRSFQVAIEAHLHGVLLDARPRKTLHPSITVHAEVRPELEDLGAAVRRVLRGADALREAGVV
ncbi:hypothetical protein [Prosthecodimorpha staleyi]|uniref:Uncharacterized protein n=1 Tax=Prosthecodimorpha staleyi TaxID=2840188 RepID=A0A947D3H6_9HYPH|nr:hypothetical protein [Prosthecodimorpha staleyi]MBT9290086.1 hypothetical protein [Prosthecodimorpha staleyi]